MNESTNPPPAPIPPYEQLRFSLGGSWLARAVSDMLNAWLNVLSFVFSVLGAPMLLILHPLVYAFLVIVYWIGERLSAFYDRFFAARMTNLVVAAGATWTSWKSDPYWLRKYGASMETDQVKSDHTMMRWVLSCSLVFFLFAHNTLWWYTGILLLWLLLIPQCFAIMELIVDRFVMIGDDDGGMKWATILGRIGIVSIMALITAVPIELAVFESEIDDVRHDVETAKLDAIRAKARETEEEIVAHQQAATSGTLTAGVSDVTTRRAADRAVMLARQDTERAALVAQIDQVSDELVSEISRGSRSGHGSGNGPVAKSLREKKEVLIARLEAFHVAAKAERDSFDAKTESMRTSATKAVTDDQSAHAVALDLQYKRIEAMTPDELVAAYGGEYKEPNGFLTRYRTMDSIINAPDPEAVGFLTPNQMIAWGCRLLMWGFTLLALFIKYVAISPQTKAYYSLTMQALHGNEDALIVMRLRAQRGDEKAIQILRRRPDADAASKVVLALVDENNAA